jgi:hypothetical protein
LGENLNSFGSDFGKPINTLQHFSDIADCADKQEPAKRFSVSMEECSHEG